MESRYNEYDDGAGYYSAQSSGSEQQAANTASPYDIKINVPSTVNGIYVNVPSGASIMNIFFRV